MSTKLKRRLRPVAEQTATGARVPEPSGADNPSKLLIVLVAFVVPCLLYASSATAEFAFDDERGVVTNHDVRKDTPWLDLLKHDFWGTPMAAARSHKSYRPITVASFKATTFLFGLDSAAFHVGNIIIHSTTCSLFTVLAIETLGVEAGMTAAALFLVHPIHTEAVSTMLLNPSYLAQPCFQVANVVGRAELLSGCFFLLSILMYQRSCKWVHA
jgi:hypothetical protein